MGEPTVKDHEFTDIIAGLLHDLLKASGITMLPSKHHEKIRAIAEKLSVAIEWRAEHKAVEVVRVLQKAVVEAFAKTEAAEREQEDRIKALEDRIAALEGSTHESPTDGTD